MWLFALLTAALAGFVGWNSYQSKSAPPIKSKSAPLRVAAAVPSVAKTNPSAPKSVAPAPLTNPPAATVTNLGVVPPPVASATAAEINDFPRPAQGPLEIQIALARRGISPGSIDGVMGGQTRAALAAWQRQVGLAVTGELDANTRAQLQLDTPPLTTYAVTSNDLSRLQPIQSTWLGKSRQSALDYETILELVAERGCASPTLVRKLNPAVNWTNVSVGAVLTIPAVEVPAMKTKAAFVVISLAARQLQAFDGETNLLVHFPCSIAARVEKRPAGELRVVAVAPNPDYTFNPEVFPESPEAQQLRTKLILPPGPNNPVGTAWISLDKPGYGIHGTPSPEQVGRTESHGCFRLANWNAEYLLKLVWIGMPVRVEP